MSWVVIARAKPVHAASGDSPASVAGMAVVATVASAGDARHFERMQTLARAGRRPGAILFADLEASSPLARRLPTASYFSLGRRLVRVADQCVIDAGGLVGRHGGDGVVAFFLAEIAGAESAAARGCIEAARARIDEAYDVLLDPARRRPYELSVFPEAPEGPAKVPQEAIPSAELPPAPSITPDTDFSGGLLRAVRESQGTSLEQISERTKVGTSYLRCIEEEDFDKLPAAVYVRGFVTEFAKCLRLDPEQVSQSYIRRYRARTEAKEGGA